MSNGWTMQITELTDEEQRTVRNAEVIRRLDKEIERLENELESAAEQIAGDDW